VIIDAEGYVVGALRGEGHRQQMDRLIQKHLAEADAKGLSRPTQEPVAPAREPASVLRFPGKVMAMAHRLFVADSGHNRVLEVAHNGKVLDTYGGGRTGMLDGAGSAAAFNNPRGMAMAHDFLYVADAGNHAIRRVDIHCIAADKSRHLLWTCDG
jgi:hypothetical protein